MPFTERLIDVTIKLTPTGTNKPNTFAGTGTNQVTLKGVRTSVRVRNSGSLSGTAADVTMWGLSPSLINQLSTLGMVIKLKPGDTITVTAGDRASGMSTVFFGNIDECYADYNAAPEVPVLFKCFAGSADMATPFAASSYNGSTDVATIMENIAKKKGWAFENNGVKDKLSNPYLWGSVMDQIQRIKEATHINFSLLPGTQEQGSYLLAIWPQYGARTTGGVPLIAPVPKGEMIGYPSFTQQGIIVKTIFDPRIVQGGQVKVESSIFTAQVLERIGNASSVWNIEKVDLALDSLMPHGQWMTTVYGYAPGFPAPLPPQT